MNIDELINLSSTPQVIEETLEDLQKKAYTNIERLSSPSLEIVIDSFKNLQEITSKNPELTIQAFQTAMNMISSTPNSPSTNQILAFLHQVFVSKDILFTEEHIILIFEVLRVSTQVDQNAFIFAETIIKSDIYKTFTFSTYSIPNLLISVLSKPNFSLNFILKLVELNQEIFYTNSENEIIRNNLKTLLAELDFIKQIMLKIEHFQVKGIESVNLIQLLMKFSDQSIFQPHTVAQFSLIADFYHSAAYSYIISYNNNIPTPLDQLEILQTLTSILLYYINNHILDNSTVENSKIFNYLILLISCSQHEILLATSLHLIDLISSNQSLTTLSITQIPNQNCDFTSILANIYKNPIFSQEIRTNSLSVLRKIICQNKEVFAASLSKEARKGVRGDVQSGFKMIARSFLVSKPTEIESVFGKAAKAYKAGLLKLERGDFEVDGRGLTTIISILLNNNDDGCFGIILELLQNALVVQHFGASVTESCKKLAEVQFVQNLCCKFFVSMKFLNCKIVYCKLISFIYENATTYALCGFNGNFEGFSEIITFLDSSKYYDALILSSLSIDIGTEVQHYNKGFKFVEKLQNALETLRLNPENFTIHFDFEKLISEKIKTFENETTCGQVQNTTKVVNRVSESQYNQLLAKCEKLEIENQQLKQKILTLESNNEQAELQNQPKTVEFQPEITPDEFFEQENIAPSRKHGRQRKMVTDTAE
ncbi:hypothetical protein SS50377_28072 [Spironucleus salmonicida]|uniref:Uncharacterized protein n=1 Tax=Spironucleus salmonicida TaxID=348837 RepID=V6LPH4_9EUKA|nr:hypothetical protein SS50377_28072 [Spironucleus salmonicida]|eukprot:EST42624.1 Hypothetical protein SS50377_17943 [Spironucleus salmonicida]